MSDIAPVDGTPIVNTPATDFDALAALVPDAPTGVDVGTAVTSVSTKEEPAAVEPPEAKAKEPPPPEVDTEALERAEAAAQKAREGARKNRELREAQERQRQELQRAAREAEELRKQAEEYKRLQAELDADPYAALKKRGMTEQELAERALREGTPEAALHAIREELKAEREARAALEQRLAAERQAAAAEAARQKFHALADNEEAYPRLAALAHPAQLAIVQATLKQIADNGYETRGLTDEQVAAAAEKFLSPKNLKKAVAAAKTEAAPATKPAVKTLTNAVTSERAVAPRPWEELSDEEQIAQIAASLPD